MRALTLNPLSHPWWEPFSGRGTLTAFRPDYALLPLSLKGSRRKREGAPVKREKGGEGHLNIIELSIMYC